MKVSFVLPVYNVMPYLERCVQSLVCQTYKDFEIILVDDGSPDDSGKLCDELATRDKRIRVIHVFGKEFLVCQIHRAETCAVTRYVGTSHCAQHAFIMARGIGFFGLDHILTIVAEEHLVDDGV